MIKITDRKLWNSIVANELARAACGEGPADFGTAWQTYQRMEAERRQSARHRGDLRQELRSSC